MVSGRASDQNCFTAPDDLAFNVVTAESLQLAGRIDILLLAVHTCCIITVIVLISVILPVVCDYMFTAFHFLPLFESFICKSST